jgi:hypothetical protein
MYIRPTRWRALGLSALLGVAVGCDATSAARKDQPGTVDAVAVAPADAGAAVLVDETATARDSALRDPAFRLNWTGDGPTTSVDVLRLAETELQAFDQLAPARQPEVLRIYVFNGDDDDDIPPVAGSLAVDGDALRFTPRYPFARGLRFRVVFNRAPLGGASAAPPDAEQTFYCSTAAARPQPPTEIVQIYPSSDQLPENQLKFYLHFSGPMSRGQAYQRIHLLDAQGKELKAVFLELGEELWDPAMRRFTLLCDPARVKRGLLPREELGPVLTEGQDYTLVIDDDWLDANGQKLTAGARKDFHVMPPDDTPIDLTTWQLAPPKANTRDPLVVHFPEPLEHALLNRMLTVTSTKGDAIPGTVDVSDGETCWQFTPEQPWSAGDYRLVTDVALEDLAGNAVGRAFDVDTFGPIQKRIETETAAIPFSIKAG